MAVRKIKGSWWVDFRFTGQRYRKRSPDNSRAGARVYETTLRGKLVRGEPLEERNREQEQPFGEFAWKWFEIYVKNNNKPSEIESKKSTLNSHLVPYFGKTPVNNITNLHVERYKAKKINEGLCNKTVNNHLTVLSKCLRTAAEWLELEKTPKIQRLKVPPYKFDFLDPQESQLFLRHAHGVWYEMIIIALKTGLRFGELRALDWSDINWGTGVLTVRRSITNEVIGSPKNNKERSIPLTSDVSQVLKSRRQESGPVFTDENNQPYSRDRLYRGLSKICKNAGRKITWHTLRHTFASHLAMAGAPLKAIQELLGHSDITTTLRYAHLSPSTLANTIRLLEPQDTPKILGNLRQPK